MKRFKVKHLFICVLVEQGLSNKEYRFLDLSLQVLGHLVSKCKLFLDRKSIRRAGQDASAFLRLRRSEFIPF